jgi:hypothetical protein
MDANKYLQVDWITQILTGTTSRRFDCNTLVMVNQGTQAVVIDGNLTLTPGQSFTYECYPGEMNAHSFDIVFTNDQAAGCKLVVLQKVYKPNYH